MAKIFYTRISYSEIEFTGHFPGSLYDRAGSQRPVHIMIQCVVWHGVMDNRAIGVIFN